jgi:hypothetical protein
MNNHSYGLRSKRALQTSSVPSNMTTSQSFTEPIAKKINKNGPSVLFNALKSVRI